MARINKALAESFIGRVNRQLGYKINVFNEKAIIIASTDRQRVGDFHSGVHRMMRENIPAETICRPTPDMIGVRQGANMLLLSGGIPVGAVGITGDPGQVMEPLRMVKMTLETMLEYEQKQELMLHRRSTGGEFVYALLYDQLYRSEVVERLATASGFTESRVRIPVVVSASLADSFREKLAARYAKLPGSDGQDIAFLSGDSQFVVFKAITREGLRDYRSHVENLVADIIEMLAPHVVAGFDTVAFCGMPQVRFPLYAEALDQLHWLARQPLDRGKSLHFFADHHSGYMMDRLPRRHADAALYALCAQVCAAVGKAEFLEFADALLRNNLHLNRCAHELYLHKNTVAKRLKKINEVLGISPHTCSADRILLQALVDYLKQYGDATDFLSANSVDG